MSLLSDYLAGCLDLLTGYLALTIYVLAVTDEREIWRRLKKLPLLLLSPLIAVLLSAGLSAVPELRIYRYFVSSGGILVMCTLWVCRTWQFGFCRALAAVCMASIFQVASATSVFRDAAGRQPIHGVNGAASGYQHRRRLAALQAAVWEVVLPAAGQRTCAVADGSPSVCTGSHYGNVSSTGRRSPAPIPGALLPAGGDGYPDGRSDAAGGSRGTGGAVPYAVRVGCRV